MKHEYEAKFLEVDVAGRVVNRRDNQYDEVIVDRETSEVVREVHESPSQHYGHGSGRRRRECSRVPADPQGLLDYRVTR
jgi:hypothetical protein